MSNSRRRFRYVLRADARWRHHVSDLHNSLLDGGRWTPPMDSSPLQSAMVSVDPCKTTRFWFLNSLSVRVTVSRVVPTNSAISSCVRGSLICVPDLVGFPSEAH